MDTNPLRCDFCGSPVEVMVMAPAMRPTFGHTDTPTRERFFCSQVIRSRHTGEPIKVTERVTVAGKIRPSREDS